jgi:hypothetical protein
MPAKLLVSLSGSEKFAYASFRLVQSFFLIPAKRLVADVGTSSGILTCDGHTVQPLYRSWCLVPCAWAGAFHEFAMLAAQVDFMQNA